MRTFLLLVSGILLMSCSPRFKKGGYYYSDKNKSYYGNDRKKIYFQFSPRFSYSERNFNALQYLPRDFKMLKEFAIQPSQRVLFTYHSYGRNMAAVLEPKSLGKNTRYHEVKTSNGRSFLYHSETQDSAIVVDNLYPFKNRYIRIIEKTKRLPGNAPVKQKSEQQETFIFPEITDKKPF